MSWLCNFGASWSLEVCEKSSAAWGRVYRFTFPDDLLSPAQILERLDGVPWTGDGALAGRELRASINKHAKHLPYPASALVIESSDDAEDCPCLLTICTVLAKSSDRVYLASKTPNLNFLTPGRTVCLFVPELRRAQAK